MDIQEVHELSDALLLALRALTAELAPAAPPLTHERLQEIVASDCCNLLVATMQDAQVGGMVTLASYPIPSGRHFWIEDVVVAAAARGQGIGEALVRRAIELARAAGAASVDLTSRPSRESANRLYLRLGFEPRETNVYRLTLGQ